jgi:Acetyltransferase (GNAT) domain
MTESSLKNTASIQGSQQTRCEILRPEDYSLWDSLVDASPHGTVFHYSWWLQIATRSFQILVIRDNNGTIVGGIPLPRTRRSGLSLVHSPRLTPYLGPIFDLSSVRNTCDRLHFMRTHGESLARAIRSFDSFRCVAGASAPDLQGFLWAGFSVKLAYTFRFQDTSADSVAKAMTRTHHQKLTRAERLGLTVHRDGCADDLITLNRMTFERQGTLPSYSPDLVRQLWEAARARDKAQIYVARTQEGVPAAALFTVHDRRATYQIVSGVNWNIRDVQGGYLVLWRAIQDALTAGRAFDFEGSALRGVETYYRRWGPASVPVWRIEKPGTWRGTLLQYVIQRRDAAANQSRSASLMASS